MPNKAGMVFLCFGGGVIKINRGIAVVVAAIILLLFLQSGVCAAGAATVYADKVNAGLGETVLIPVKIKDNPGIMGFKINLQLPTPCTNPKVTSGNVTAKGMLNDSILNSSAESFDVVWTGTENVEGAGVLFTVSVDVMQNAELKDYKIALSFSQADTFNEKYEDVFLDCKEITLTIGSESNLQANTTGGGATIENGIQPTITETTQMSAQSKTTEEAKDEYVSDVLIKIDSTDVADIVNDAVKEFDVKSVAEVPPDKQAYFVKAVEEKLMSLAPDVKSFESAGMDTAQAVEAIEQLAQVAKEYATEGVNVSEEVGKLTENAEINDRINKITVFILSVAGVVILAAVAACVIKKSKEIRVTTNEEDKTQ